MDLTERRFSALTAAAARVRVVWLVVAGMLAALVVVHLFEPKGPVGDATYLAGCWGAALLAWVGALRRPRGRSLIPELIAVGLTASAVGDLVWLVYVWNGHEPDVSLADVAYLAGYAGLAAALVLATLVRTRAGVRVDRDAIIDALTIIVVSVLVLWHVSIADIVADTTVSGLTRAVWAVYPVLDAIFLALVARALVSRQGRSSIGLSFAGGLVFWMAADIGYLLTVSGGVNGPLDAGWMLGAMLMSASAWRRHVPVPETVAETEVATGHPIWKLGIATVPILVPLALHFYDDVRGVERNLLATLTSVVLLLALSFVRSARLLQSESVARTEARASRDAALEASRAKSAFLATMSHEIRTPMNGVIGLTGLLQGTELDQRQRQYVDGVHVAGESLLRIINDILDFSKVEAGKLELDIIDFNLLQVVEEAAELVAEPAQAKGLELLAYCAPDLPLSLRGDPTRLRQVLLNLATNAVKFTDQGEVVVRAHLEDRTAALAVVRFEVTDSGIGLDAEDRQRLFEPFSQADSSTTRRFGGTGLGLAICHQLVTAMGGDLGVDSEIGRGSTFWFTLPLGLVPDPTAGTAPSEEGLAAQRVLIVDDNATNRLILGDQLRAWGVRREMAVDAASALSQLERAAQGDDPFTSALLDLCMPDMDGLELARRISGNPALADVALVLLTSVSDVSTQEATAAGIVVRMTKPVQMSRLRAVLQDLRPATAPEMGRSASAQSDERSRSRGHVLVVEDNAVNQLVAVGILEHLGYTAEVAANGVEALVSLTRSSFAAVLMDCQMPEMDGYTATAQLRRVEGKAARTPVIAMTASVTEGERERCAAAGMDDYVSKPMSPGDLDTTLARWLPATLD